MARAAGNDTVVGEEVTETLLAPESTPENASTNSILGRQIHSKKVKANTKRLAAASMVSAYTKPAINNAAAVQRTTQVVTGPVNIVESDAQNSWATFKDPMTVDADGPGMCSMLALTGDVATQM